MLKNTAFIKIDIAYSVGQGNVKIKDFTTKPIVTNSK